MSKERIPRKLTTILVADVEGYSQQMHSDEEATLQSLESCRAVFDQLIAQHEGRIFNTGGDSVLVEFTSAVEALRCALAFQREVAGQNVGPGKGQALRFRIGINIGDVMIRDGNLLGDGVNVAARLEGIAEPGGICISGSVFEQVKNKVSGQFDNMGPQTVKNIAEPVQAYRVGTGKPAGATTRPGAGRTGRFLPFIAVAVVVLAVGGFALWQRQAEKIETASVARMVLPLPNKPSIAVLPFSNFGTSSLQELLGDGIARDIISDLSAFSDLMVISSTSSFSYKDKSTELHQVAEDLGVRFILDGSIQAVGENARISVELVDAISGQQLWAEQYDRRIEDIFAIQDEVSQNVVAALGAMEGPVALSDRARIRSKQDTNLTAYEFVLLAREARNAWTADGNAKSLELVQKAIALDPQYARAHVEQAWTYFQDVTRYRTQPPKEAAEKALESTLKAIELDESFAEGYWVAGDIYAWLLQHPDKALAAYDRALALNPNHADILAAWGGWILPTVLNRPQEGIEVMKKAMRLSPFHEDWFNWGMMNAYFMARQFDKAVLAFQKIEHPSRGMHLRLLASYAYLGKTEQTRMKAEELLGKYPDFSIEEYLNTSRSYQTYGDLLREGLLLAGMPE